jgi:hypothetical protein
MQDILCKHCDHFVEENTNPEEIIETTDTTIKVRYDDGSTDIFARYVHLEDGEQEFDHDAEPGETRDDWEKVRPDLFVEHADGKIGPNSIFHSQRGKIDDSR